MYKSRFVGRGQTLTIYKPDKKIPASPLFAAMQGFLIFLSCRQIGHAPSLPQRQQKVFFRSRRGRASR